MSRTRERHGEGRLAVWEGSELNNPSAPDTAVRHKELQLGFNVLSFGVLKSSDVMSSGTEVRVSQVSKETTSQFIIWVLCNEICMEIVQWLVSSALNNAGNRRLAVVDGETGWDSAKLRPDWAVEEARELRVYPAWKLRSCGRTLISWWNLMQAGAKVSGGYSRLAVYLLSETA